LAFTKKEKGEISARYEKWLSETQALFVLDYKSMTMKEVDAFRAKARENGSEIHLVKNTLFTRALESQGYKVPDYFEGTSLVGLRSTIPLTGEGFHRFHQGKRHPRDQRRLLGKEVISAQQVKALADLPSLPVMRATLLGIINAPASKLVRTLAEPGRSMAAVVKAFSEKAVVAA